LNQAKLKDEAIVNPWIDDNSVNKNYLSTESTVTINNALDAGEPAVASLLILLSDNKILRSRSVYTIVDMIADVSGMVDLLMVFSGFIMATLFTK
jgi:hypothetical protein